VISSLKDILDDFQCGRREAKEFLDDYKDHVSGEPLRMDDLVDAENQPTDNKIPAYLRSYSPLEKVAYAIGIFSRPKAVYEMVKLVFSGDNQGISQEEIEEDLKESKEKQ